MLTSLDCYDNGGFGLKKEVSGGLLIDFGAKRNVRLKGADLGWQNVVEVREGGMLQDYEDAESILYYKEFARLFYADSEKSLWFSSDIDNSVYAVDKIAREDRFVWKGDLCFKKDKVGFFVNILGNYYFLPKGESLMYFRRGLWDGNYLKQLGVVGKLFESLITYLKKGPIVGDRLETARSLATLLEYFLLNQVLLAVENSGGSRVGRKPKKNRNRRSSGDVGQGTLYQGVSLYYLSIEPVLLGLGRLLRKLDSMETAVSLSDLVKAGSVLESQQTLANIEGLLEVSPRAVLSKSFNRDALVGGVYLLDVYCVLLEMALNKAGSVEFRVDSYASLDVAFSNVVERSENKFSSVSRRAIGRTGL